MNPIKKNLIIINPIKKDPIAKDLSRGADNLARYRRLIDSLQSNEMPCKVYFCLSKTIMDCNILMSKLFHRFFSYTYFVVYFIYDIPIKGLMYFVGY